MLLARAADWCQARHPFAAVYKVGPKSWRQPALWTAPNLTSKDQHGARAPCHPHVQTDIFDLSHLVLANNCNIRSQRRALFFDLGASDGGRRHDWKSDAAPRGQVQSSLPVFFQLFRRNCIVFDRYCAWRRQSAIRSHGGAGCPCTKAPRSLFSMLVWRVPRA